MGLKYLDVKYYSNSQHHTSAYGRTKSSKTQFILYR